MRAVGHVPEHMTSAEAIAAGYDSISHLEYIFDAVPISPKLPRRERFAKLKALDLASAPFTRELDLLVAHHVVVDDTLAIYEQGWTTSAEFAKVEPGVATVPRELAPLVAATSVAPDDAADGAAVFAKYIELVRRLHARGIPIVAGTDITVPGHSVHRELELYVQAGFTPLEALQAATIVPARYMKRDRELGTVEVGKLADLVVLGGDPLADIHNIRKTKLVVVRGRVYDSPALWRLAGFK